MRGDPLSESDFYEFEDEDYEPEPEPPEPDEDPTDEEAEAQADQAAYERQNGYETLESRRR